MLASEGEKRERFVLVFCFFLVRITVPRDGRSYTAVFVQHSRIHGPFYSSPTQLVQPHGGSFDTPRH